MNKTQTKIIKIENKKNNLKFFKKSDDFIYSNDETGVIHTNNETGVNYDDIVKNIKFYLNKTPLIYEKPIIIFYHIFFS